MGLHATVPSTSGQSLHRGSGFRLSLGRWRIQERRMTLIVGIPASDGVVFASDGQVTTGAVRSTAPKIYDLNDWALWAASGELALIQRVNEQVAMFAQREQPLEAIRDDLAQMVRMAVDQLLKTDFRTQFVAGNPEALLGLHPADFLFVEYRDGRSRILHLLTNGTSEWIEGRAAATGVGDVFAYALLAKYARRDIRVEHAKILAYKVIEEAIEVGAYGLGPPIDVWEISEKGKKKATEEELAALADTVEVVREREVELLTGGELSGAGEEVNEVPALANDEEAIDVREDVS